MLRNTNFTAFTFYIFVGMAPEKDKYLNGKM